MKKKYTLILLFMVVFVGVTLLGYTPARAEAPVLPCSPGDPPPEEGICVNIYKGDQIAYVVRAVLEDGTDVTPSDVGVWWPYQAGGTGPWIFKYEVGPTQAAMDRQIKGLSAVSYVLTRLRGFPLPGSDPPGAQLDVTNIDPTCQISLSPWVVYYKWNASVNNKTSDTITILAPSRQIDDCGYVSVLFKSDCDGGPLFVAKLGDVTPFEPSRTFECEEVDVRVEYDRCDGRVLNVFCNGTLAYGPTEDPYFYAHMADGTTRSFRIENMGPQSGLVVCAGAAPPVFVVGHQAWWCGGLPSP